MSYDSDIAYYRRERKKLMDAIPYVRAAINDYNEALAELKKIKGVKKCSEFRTKIGDKINMLENEINVMQTKINNYTSKIASLKRAKAAAEARANEGGA